MQEVGHKALIVLGLQRSVNSSNGQQLFGPAEEVHKIGGAKHFFDLQHANTSSKPSLQMLPTILLFFRNEELSVNTQSPSLPASVYQSDPQPHIAQALMRLGFGDFAEVQ